MVKHSLGIEVASYAEQVKTPPFTRRIRDSILLWHLGRSIVTIIWGSFLHNSELVLYSLTIRINRINSTNFIPSLYDSLEFNRNLFFFQAPNMLIILICSIYFIPNIKILPPWRCIHALLHQQSTSLALSVVIHSQSQQLPCLFSISLSIFGWFNWHCRRSLNLSNIPSSTLRRGDRGGSNNY